MKVDFQTVVDLYPYGASEIRRATRRSLSWALGAAVFFQVLLVGSWIGGRALGKEDEAPTVRVKMITDPTQLSQPPSLQETAAQAINVSAPAVRPTVAVPVPVPDALVPEDQTIATQQEIREIEAPIMSTGGDSLVISPDAVVYGEQEPDLDEFVAVEVEPVPIKQVSPEFPRLAQEAEIEGRVIVKALVDKEGRVKKVVVMSGPEVFQEAAKAAAMQWVFKPAIQKDKPISVWVAIPFNFRLKQQ
jgi:periplasmic protein TonB